MGVGESPCHIATVCTILYAQCNSLF